MCLALALGRRTRSSACPLPSPRQRATHPCTPTLHLSHPLLPVCSNVLLDGGLRASIGDLGNARVVAGSGASVGPFCLTHAGALLCAGSHRHGCCRRTRRLGQAPAGSLGTLGTLLLLM